MTHFHNAKIIATMWPAIDKETVLSKVVNNIDVFRINLSHGDEETKRKHIDIILKLDSSKTIILDLRWPEIRTKNKELITLKKGQVITIWYSEYFQEEGKNLLIDYPNPLRIPIGTVMSVDNDKVKIEITGHKDHTLVGKVLIGNSLPINKVVDFDNHIPKLSFLTEKDKQQIVWGIENKINLIAVGNLRDRGNVADIKEFLQQHGWQRVKIIAKIETTEAIENFQSIVMDSDGVMLSREKLRILIGEQTHEQKKAELIRQAHFLGKPILMSAGLSITGEHDKKILDMLIEEIKLGVDAILLTKETAVGQDPLDTVMMIYEMINDIEYQPQTDYTLQDINFAEENLVTDYIIHNAYKMTQDLDIKAIICPTETGYTAARLSALKPPVPIIAFTKNDEAYRYMNLLRGVKSYKIASSFDYANIKQIGKEMIRILFKGNISLDDKVMIVHSQGNGWGSWQINGVELYKFKDI